MLGHSSASSAESKLGFTDRRRSTISSSLPDVLKRIPAGCMLEWKLARQRYRNATIELLERTEQASNAMNIGSIFYSLIIFAETSMKTTRIRSEILGQSRSHTARGGPLSSRNRRGERCAQCQELCNGYITYLQTNRLSVWAETPPPLPHSSS